MDDELRYEELYERAVANLLDKTDADLSEWLCYSDAKEFIALSKKLFGYE